MADKKLNEVTKVTDMAYVPVIMADGSIGQIAKADLASVVAERLALKALNMDPDNIRTTSFWTIAAENSGYNIPTSYGVLVCIYTGGAYPMLQIVHDRQTYKMWHRTADANWKWSEWFLQQ